MKSVFLFSFLSLFTFNLFAQNGNVGVGTTNPQAKLHVDGSILAEDTVTIKDANGNDRFVFDPASSHLRLLDDNGNVFFSIELEGGSSNLIKNSSSTRLIALEPTFSWKIHQETGILIQSFVNESNSKLIREIDPDLGFDLLTWVDFNGTVRKKMDNTKDSRKTEYFDENAKKVFVISGTWIDNSYCQLIEHLDANEMPIKTFKRDSNGISVIENNGNCGILNSDGSTIKNAAGKTATLTPDLFQILSENGNDKSLMGIGSATIKEGTDMAELNEFGIAQLDNATLNSFFADKFGISSLGPNINDLAGFGFDPFNQTVDVYDNMNVMEDLNVSGAKSFRIDHPLDPQNKFLYHNAIESPAPLNLYRGNVTTDVKGIATIQLPIYFQKLNIEYSYHLTTIGTFAQAMVDKEIKNNQFSIRTSEPNVKVSWQVIGQRNDPYFQDKPFVAERDKVGKDKGRLLYDPNRKEPYSENLKQHRKHHQSALRKIEQQQ